MRNRELKDAISLTSFVRRGQRGKLKGAQARLQVCTVMLRAYRGATSMAYGKFLDPTAKL